MSKVKVPKRIIWQLDQQIKKQAERVTSAQKHLDELRSARDGMVPIETGYGDKSKGGYARAEALSPDRRSEIAKGAAVKRWKRGY